MHTWNTEYGQSPSAVPVCSGSQLTGVKSMLAMHMGFQKQQMLARGCSTCNADLMTVNQHTHTQLMYTGRGAKSAEGTGTG